ncbi:hypothetical protein CMO90_01190 [Candidatus Woesearchaeota archaeon]|nr:hypothetical protein [Candidatus Woesearchaeota archaeon]
MDSKGPILISYLSQIILIIILFQASDLLKAFTNIALMASLLLVITTMAKEKRLAFSQKYSFFTFIILALFVFINISSKTSDSLSILIILSLIIGFFLTAFSKEETTETKIVDLEMPKKPRIVSAKDSLKYHSTDCGYVNNAKELKFFNSEKQAEAMGLNPCKMCQ